MIRTYKGLNFFDSSIYDFKDKEKCISNYIFYMLNRTQCIFKWKNLPPTIPSRIMELYLQCNGNCFFTKEQGQYYIFTGGLGGEPDEYYMPTIYTVSNPYLKISKNYKIGEEGVVIPNDTFYIGLLPMFRKYATLMVENDLSMSIAEYNTRVTSLLSASDDKTLKSSLLFLDQIKRGEQGVIGEGPMFDGVKAQHYADTVVLEDLSNFAEYIRKAWYNDIGLFTNQDMSRQYVSNDELDHATDTMLPMIDDMLRNRRRAIEKINDMYELAIEVDLYSSWEDTQSGKDISIGGNNEENDGVDGPYFEPLDKKIENVDNVSCETIDNTKLDTNDVSEENTKDTQPNEEERERIHTNDEEKEENEDDEKTNSSD